MCAESTSINVNFLFLGDQLAKLKRSQNLVSQLFYSTRKRQTFAHRSSASTLLSLMSQRFHLLKNDKSGHANDEMLTFPGATGTS
jgi:hypothetical protein